jgi:hypothetical protein
MRSESRMSTTSTRNVWLASYLLAHGLTFARATRLTGPTFRVNFRFDDPRNDTPMLTRKFLDDVAVQRLVTARRALAEALDVVRDRGACEPDDIADVLAAVDVPWSRDARDGGTR